MFIICETLSSVSYIFNDSSLSAHHYVKAPCMASDAHGIETIVVNICHT